MIDSAGGIVMNNGKVAVVVNKGGTYTFPKGHLHERETGLEAAYREIYEETGLNEIHLVKELETYTRASARTGLPKHIQMFLFATENSELKPVDPENPKAIWVDLEEVASHLSHHGDKDFFLRHKDEIYTLQ